MASSRTNVSIHARHENAGSSSSKSRAVCSAVQSRLFFFFSMWRRWVAQGRGNLFPPHCGRNPNSRGAREPPTLPERTEPWSILARFDILLPRPSVCPVPYNTLNNLKEDDGEKGPPSNKIRHSESRKSWIQCQPVCCPTIRHIIKIDEEKKHEYTSARRRQIYEQRDGTNRVFGFVAYRYQYPADTKTEEIREKKKKKDEATKPDGKCVRLSPSLIYSRKNPKKPERERESASTFLRSTAYATCIVICSDIDEL